MVGFGDWGAGSLAIPGLKQLIALRFRWLAGLVRDTPQLGVSDYRA